MLEIFRSRLDQAIADHIFPGYSFAYLANGEAEVCSGGHFTYDENSPSVDAATVYDVASLTKIIGPMAVTMMLLDDGVLNLDDRIGTYLESFRSDVFKQEATIRHALTYTLDYNIPGGSKSLMQNLSSQEVANNAFRYPLKQAPGSNYMYSNITAFVLTQIIEKVTGRNFYELVAERVFNPLQMHTATFFPSAELLHQIPPTEITTERGEIRGFVHDEFSDHLHRGGISCGAAGLFASIQDLIPFLQMTVDGGVYQGKKFFSSEIAAKWTRDQFPQLLPTRTPLGWGDFNNELRALTTHEIVVKGGFTGCLMVGDLTTKQGFVWISNRTYPTRPEGTGTLQNLKKDLMDIFLGAKTTPLVSKD